MSRKFIAARRRTLQQLAALLGAASLPLPVAAGPSAGGGDALGRALDLLLPHRASAAAIGAAYLRTTPRESSAAALRGLVVDSLTAEGLPLTERGLLRRIERDFEREEVVRIEGWLLSATEARLCALRRLQP